ncbi:MAG: argininosuccinate lyase [Firmicutes bacterium]|nr:argininosuccinate lyase [Bacillota bacterium]
MRLWGGRFESEPQEEVLAYTSSLPYDRRLARHDVEGSRAHVRMLRDRGILSGEEAAQLLEGLDAVAREIQEGSFPFRPELEDVHTCVEARLRELVGEVAGKLHTARSRNDQVALDMHLYLRERVRELDGAVRTLQVSILDLAERHRDLIMPGYTHLQPAQPVLFAHHLLAYFFMLQRDRERLAFCREQLDRMPLGAAALAGTGFPIDPGRVAAELGFSRLYDNSMDAVSDRDYVVDVLSACALIMIHLGRLGEELVLWTSREFGFLELDDSYTTGSSIMPQKKNPDVAELVRGRVGRVVGQLTGFLMVLKGLPLTYARDLQEDKEAAFGALDTTLASLQVMAGMVATARPRAEAMVRACRGGLLTATDLADYLARKGMPFRQAHELVGRIVRYCLERQKELWELTTEEYAAFSPLFGDDVREHVTLEASVRARTSPGGTAPASVAAQLEKARALAGTSPRGMV